MSTIKDTQAGMEMYSCIKGFVEKPTKGVNLLLDELTYQACKEHAEKQKKPMTESLRDLLEDMIDNGFKPFAKPVPNTFTMNLEDAKKKVHLTIHDKEYEKAKKLAKDQNLSLQLYYRISLCAILIDQVGYKSENN